MLLAAPAEKSLPPAGLEPATFGLEVQRAIHCAKGAATHSKKLLLPLLAMLSSREAALLLASGAGGRRSVTSAFWGDSGGTGWVGSTGRQAWMVLCRCSAQVTLVCPLEAKRRLGRLGA